jgi:hypothetical protein
MAESTLSASYTTLIRDIAAFLGYDVNPANQSAAQIAEILRYLHAGVRQFYYPPQVEGIEAGYEWSFLNPTTTLDTTADDAAQDLPDDLSRVLGDFYFEPDNYFRSIVQVSEAQLQVYLQRSTDTSIPKYFSVRHKTSDGLTGQRLEVAWWPVPDAAYTLTYRYEAYAGQLDDTNEYPLGGMKYSELVKESCLAVAEQSANDEKGLHWDNFVSLLGAGVARDRKIGASYFGPMGGSRGESVTSRQVQSSYPITYDGVTW